MVESVGMRKWQLEETKAAVRELVDLGWVHGRPDSLRLTMQGRRIREGAERKTDQYFFAPWDQLPPAELSAMADLLRALQRKLMAGKS